MNQRSAPENLHNCSLELRREKEISPERARGFVFIRRSRHRRESRQDSSQESDYEKRVENCSNFPSFRDCTMQRFAENVFLTQNALYNDRSLLREATMLPFVFRGGMQMLLDNSHKIPLCRSHGIATWTYFFAVSRLIEWMINNRREDLRGDWHSISSVNQSLSKVVRDNNNPLKKALIVVFPTKPRTQVPKAPLSAVTSAAKPFMSSARQLRFKIADNGTTA